MDIHDLEPSVTIDFAVSLLPKIKTWRIASRLPPLTFQLLLFWAPSVFQSKQRFICQCLLYFLKIVWGAPSKAYFSYLQNLKCLNAEVQRQTQNQISFA